MLIEDKAKVIEIKIDNKDALTKQEMIEVLSNIDKNKCIGNIDCLNEAKYVMVNGDEHKGDVVANIFNSLTHVKYEHRWEESFTFTPFKYTVFMLDSNIPTKLSNRIKEVASNIKIEKAGQQDIADYYYKELER